MEKQIIGEANLSIHLYLRAPHTNFASTLGLITSALVGATVAAAQAETMPTNVRAFVSGVLPVHHSLVVVLDVVPLSE